MSAVLNVVARIFQNIFIDVQGYESLLVRLITFIKYSPYLFIGVVLVIIGFSIGLIRRIIHS